MKDHFQTLSGEPTVEIVNKGSRFIGIARECKIVEDAESWLAGISNRFHNATHCCYAWRIVNGGDIQIRSNDDGEPAGTAGRPILEALVREDLINTACAVVRYFGGTKLGTGGLARTYGACADETLRAGKKITKYLNDLVLAEYDYDDTGRVMTVIDRYRCRIKEKRYESRPALLIEIRQSRTKGLIEDLTNASGGRITITREIDH